MSIIAIKVSRDGLSGLKHAFGVVRGGKSSGRVEGARGRYVAKSREVVLAVLSFHMRFTFVPHTGCLVFCSMACRYKKSFQVIRRRAGRGTRGSGIIS